MQVSDGPAPTGNTQRGRCSPTWWASSRYRPADGSTGRSCSGSPAARHHSRARRSTGAWPARWSSCRWRSPGRSRSRPTTPWRRLGGVGWAGETPLWYYFLKEAEVRGGGERLGPLGGRIVAEVLLGIIDRDPESYRAVKPDWRPTLPAAGPGSFNVTDLLTAAESTPGSG